MCGVSEVVTTMLLMVVVRGMSCVGWCARIYFKLVVIDGLYNGKMYALLRVECRPKCYMRSQDDASDAEVKYWSLICDHYLRTETFAFT